MHALFLLLSLACAEDDVKPPPEANSPFFLKQSITVTATRSEIETSLAPVSASTVTSSEIALRRVQLLDQALNTLPGIYAFRGKGAQDTNAGIGLRGFSGRGSNQARTLVLIDGQPVNDSYTGQVNWTTIPIEEVERVEVVRGSFSSLYGGNAMGGVINVLTRPVTGRQAEGYGQYGNQATARYGGRIAHRFGDRLGLSLAYDRYQSGGYPSQYVANAGSAAAGGTPVTGAIPALTTSGTQTFLLGRSGDNWWNQHSLRLRGDYAFSRRTLAYMQFQRQRSGYGYDQYESYLRTAAGAVFDSGAAAITWNGANRRFSLTPATFLNGDGQTESWLLSGRVHHEFAGGARLRLDLGRIHSGLNYYSTPGTGATAAGGPGSISDRPYSSWFGGAHYHRTVAARHQVSAGTDLRHDESSLLECSVANWARRTENPATTGRAQGQAITEGAYIQDEWSATERLHVVAGARYDYWRTFDGGYGTGSQATSLASRSNQNLSAKIAARWQGPAGVALRASTGNSFRSPSVYDLYRTWRSSSGITYAANPDLKPERLYAIEFGINRRWSNRIELDAAYFRNRTSQLIYRSTDLATDPSGNYRPVVNAARGLAHGLETSARLPLRPWLFTNLSYSWNDSTIRENPALPATIGKRLPFVPEHATGGTLYTVFRRFNGSLTARYVSPMFATDQNTDTTKGVYGAYDPFFSLDAGLALPLGAHVSLECSGENLLDRIYYSYYPSPGRLVSVRLRLRL